MGATGKEEGHWENEAGIFQKQRRADKRDVSEIIREKAGAFPPELPNNGTVCVQSSAAFSVPIRIRRAHAQNVPGWLVREKEDVPSA
ncbi:UNVERIFIED_CONTAM: hypothetical protein K2H54_070066 [Gekko kuhli]